MQIEASTTLNSQLKAVRSDRNRRKDRNATTTLTRKKQGIEIDDIKPVEDLPRGCSICAGLGENLVCKADVG